MLTRETDEHLLIRIQKNGADGGANETGNGHNQREMGLCEVHVGLNDSLWRVGGCGGGGGVY